MKKELIFGILIVFLVGGFLYFQVNTVNQKNKISEKTTSSNIKENQIKNNQQKNYSLEEVAKHNSRDDCWIIINGKIYNVTNYIDNHPGGSILGNFCGQEATNAFNTKGGRGESHKPVAYEVLKDLYIGDLK